MKEAWGATGLARSAAGGAGGGTRPGRAPRRGTQRSGRHGGARPRRLRVGAPPLKEWFELADRTQWPGWRASSTQLVVARHLAGQDGALQLAERDEGELLPGRGPDLPAITRVFRAVGFGAAHLELMPAVGAPHRRPATADEGVVELVLGFAP